MEINYEKLSRCGSRVHSLHMLDREISETTILIATKDFKHAEQKLNDTKNVLEKSKRLLTSCEMLKSTEEGICNLKEDIKNKEFTPLSLSTALTTRGNIEECIHEELVKCYVGD